MVGCGAYFVFEIFLRRNRVYFYFFFFFNLLSYKGERFFFFHHQQAKNRARRSTMDPKIDTFCQIDISDLAILGVKKVVFWTFSKIF